MSKYKKKNPQPRRNSRKGPTTAPTIKCHNKKGSSNRHTGLLVQKTKIVRHTTTLTDRQCKVSGVAPRGARHSGHLQDQLRGLTLGGEVRLGGGVAPLVAGAPRLLLGRLLVVGLLRRLLVVVHHERRVLLLRYAHVVAGVGLLHYVAGAGVQQDGLLVEFGEFCGTDAH